MSLEEKFFPDRRRLMAALNQDFATLISETVRKRRKCSMALAGGTTPGPLYEHLSNLPLPWAKVTATVTDERWVSPEDPASNEWLVRDLLLKRRAAEATFIPFKTNHAKASGAPAAVDKRLAPAMPFDICLLGMGPDGHVASLIPGSDGYDAAMNSKRMTAAVTAIGAAGSPERLSLTPAAIHGSKHIVVLFMGNDKMAVYNEAKAGGGITPMKDILTQKKTPIDIYWAP